MADVTLNFSYAQSVMDGYIKTLEKERPKPWKQTASKVLNIALYTIGVLVFVTSSVVGLPAWMIVGAFVGWTVSVILSGIWASRIKSKNDAITNDIEICKLFRQVSVGNEYNEEQANYHNAYHDLLNKKFDALSITCPNTEIEKNILEYSKGVINLHNSEKSYQEYVNRTQQDLDKIFKAKAD